MVKLKEVETCDNLSPNKVTSKLMNDEANEVNAVPLNNPTKICHDSLNSRQDDRSNCDLKKSSNISIIKIPKHFHWPFSNRKRRNFIQKITIYIRNILHKCYYYTEDSKKYCYQNRFWR